MQIVSLWWAWMYWWRVLPRVPLPILTVISQWVEKKEVHSFSLISVCLRRKLSIRELPCAWWWKMIRKHWKKWLSSVIRPWRSPTWLERLPLLIPRKWRKALQEHWRARCRVWQPVLTYAVAVGRAKMPLLKFAVSVLWVITLRCG